MCVCVCVCVCVREHRVPHNTEAAPQTRRYYAAIYIRIYSCMSFFMYIYTGASSQSGYRGFPHPSYTVNAPVRDCL